LLNAFPERLPHVYAGRLDPLPLPGGQLATKEFIQRLLLPRFAKPQRLAGFQIAHHRELALPGPLNYTEGPPPAGITDTLKSINNRTDDFISTENGKEVLKTHVVVSANHKTMIITRSGVDDKGAAFTSIEAYDRQ
jgi:hypothetical protein